MNNNNVVCTYTPGESYCSSESDESSLSLSEEDMTTISSEAAEDVDGASSWAEDCPAPKNFRSAPAFTWKSISETWT